ncbi:staphylococcal nuclease domain-containing protein 1 [Folsomia candida]|uniref:Staphylococcal nuclease domain-containing protein 1 n=1 Tax=Folsomia candida TaxID=158441 RepID=A0A226E676_FOLCA|nr:staphylococcal nuclease domain-containing protein 1 [Folsomia candida]OXA52850.1 Nuclease domain-containing protein 1 [Folsomia candida]
MSVQPQPIIPAVPQYLKGFVKQVLSGDSIIIRGVPKRGPPPERQLNLSSISAPRLARRPGGNVKIEDSKDEPWAWEAREFMRKKLVGKEVWFAIDYKVPASGREYGVVLLGRDAHTAENITEAIISAGLATVRKEGKSDVSALVELEEAAKSAGKGKWGPDPPESHVRNITWSLENPRSLLEKFGRKPVQAVVEHVRDGSTIRVLLLPSFHYVTVMISGIRCPGFKVDSEGKPDPSTTEAFAEEAKFFTEIRLLQSDVEVALESVNNQSFVGSVIHPNGNIAELLLRDGFARCIDWSMGFVSGGAEPLRTAEKVAKEKKLRLWKDYQANQASGLDSLKPKDKDFVGTVVECINADALVVKLQDGTLKKVFLASIRPPRQETIQEKLAEGQTKEAPAPKEARPKGFRPLYDIPFMYEAREYMRKKLIGKKVQVSVDYIQPTSNNFPEKIGCTVKSDGVNIGEALLTKGLATVIRYRQDDDQRASDYDTLLAAEAKAQKALKGLHGKDTPTHHVIDITGDAAKAKQFLPYFQRAGKLPAVVEYVASGSRLRVYVPREARLITLLLAGISCPRAGRTVPGGSASMEAEPFGDEALAFTKDVCHQREVEIEVDSIDKAGNFIGFIFIEGKNLSVALVDEGLASVHFSAEKTPYFRPLQIAEDNAKARREKIWMNYEDTKDDVKPEDDKAERKYEPKKVIVTEVTNELHIFVQFTDHGAKLEALTSDIRRELAEKPPLTGAYTPKKGDLCVARFSADNEWYRAKIEKVEKDQVHVLYIDYGNREVIKSSRCAVLPSVPGASDQGFAKEYTLGFVSLPSDPDYAQEAIYALKHDTQEGNLLLNIEYRNGGIEYVSLAVEESKADIAQNLVKEGLLMVENRKERRLQKLVKDFKTAESEAKMKHLNIWQYGDITEDDAREFGMSNRN